MEAAEFKSLCDSTEYLQNAEKQLKNLANRVRAAKKAADNEYQANKKTQPSWKPLRESLGDLDKAVAPALKATLSIYAAIPSKKESAGLALADVKKAIKDKYMPKLQAMDDAAADALAKMLAVLKQVDKGDRFVSTDLQVTKIYSADFSEAYNRYKLDFNRLK